MTKQILLSQITDKDIARFWSHVDKSGECWNWTASRKPQGYGEFGINRHLVYAHRLAYELTYGPIPNGMQVCHHCDNRACVRPDHLFVGDQSANMQDMVSKRRVGAWTHPESLARGNKHGRHTHPETTARGERAGRAKLTEEQVRDIRKRYADGETQTELARQFHVDRGNIRFIVTRMHWKHVI